VHPVIAVLPATVIDQIAAGEVIERPASVVKELVDNAIDAGAKAITVETTAGGRGSIRVVDDGCGMSPKDAVLAFERHATSKISRVDDLWGLQTMGFRGEALPSIASVSRMALTTRREGDLAGTRIQIDGGRLISVTEVGAPVGTTVEITDLFYNVPVRLKFLKGEATEASHITELVARVAMARPELHLRLKHNGRVALEAPPDRDGWSRAHALLGVRIASRMVPVSGEEGGVRVTAYLGSPDLAQTTTRGVQLFVERRPVRDRGLLHALAMGYGELVPRGRYPVAVVMVDVPAGAVDINVHPQKLEVRFSDAAAVCAAVRHVVQSGVARAPWRDEVGGGPVMMTASVAPPRLPFDGEATGMSQRYAAQLSQGRLGFDDGRGSQAFESTRQSGPRSWVQVIKDRVRSSRAAEAQVEARFAFAVGKAEKAIAAQPDDPNLAHGSGPVTQPGFFGSLRYLGQLDLTYLVCEADGELVLIDQHVAHEGVELARLKAGQGDRDVATQRMLFPTTIEVAPELVGLAEKMSGVLAQVGFEAEAFGTTTLAVKAVPGGIRHGDPTQLLRKLLHDWVDDGAPTEAERLESVLAEIACHSVVRAGDRLSPSEAEALLRTMDGADFSTHGPHGRPVLLRLPLTEIARRFGR
jgi:DNA mismatch repair protein MutL